MNSEYFQFIPCDQSSELLIIFSGAGARSFNCYKLMKDYPINRLFIRDQTRSWYQNPVAGHWQNIDGMIELIRSVSDRFRYNLVTMGGSAGGYAAMVIAAKLRASRALVFSPQTVLDHRLPNNPTKKIRLRYADVFSELAQSPGTRVQIYLGTEDLADMYNVSPALHYRGFDLSFIHGAPHNVMNFLYQRNMLRELIFSFLEKRQPQLLMPEFNMLNCPELYRSICDFVRGFYFDEADYPTLNQLLDKLQLANGDWPALYHFRGKLDAKFGHHDKAVTQFEQAILRADSNDDIFSDLGSSAIQTREYEKAEAAFRKAVEVSIIPSPAYLSKLGATLMLQKRYDEAVDMQYQALQADETFSPAYYQLGLVMNIRGRYDEAVPMFERAIELGNKNPNVLKHLATARDKVETVKSTCIQTLTRGSSERPS